jgi:DNA-binding HxlR family transcriptional regulator
MFSPSKVDHQLHRQRFIACPTNRLLATLGHKWTPVTLHALVNSRMRYSELRRAIPSATHKMLTQTLRSLERDGFVQRHVTGDKPPLVSEYELSALGRSLLPVLVTVTAWANTHDQEIGAARRRF